MGIKKTSMALFSSARAYLLEEAYTNSSFLKNKQHLSFIEQQMSLYRSTDCFDSSNEVLRRGVEIVEYINDVLDSFL
jgi:hypothetical protein